MIATLHRTLIAKRNENEENDKGFTLIELLVVVLIIGILAAIAIPVFLAQQDNAKDSAVASDLANAKVAYTSYLVSTPAASTVTVANLESAGFTASDGVTVTVPSSSSTAFCIQGTRTNSTKTWSITNTRGVKDVACSA